MHLTSQTVFIIEAKCEPGIYRIRTFPSTPTFALPTPQISPSMHLGDLKKRKGGDRGGVRRRSGEWSQEGNRKKGAKGRFRKRW